MTDLPKQYAWLEAELGPRILVEALKTYGRIEKRGGGSSRAIRLVYLAPEVLERLVISLEPAQYAVSQLCHVQREHGSHWLSKFGENADERSTNQTEYCSEASDKGSDWQARIPATGYGLGRKPGGGGQSPCHRPRRNAEAGGKVQAGRF